MARTRRGAHAVARIVPRMSSPRQISLIKAMVWQGTGRPREDCHPKERSSMPDDLSRARADRSRIDLKEPDEVQYWADQFGVSKERLSEVVRKVGHSAEAVGRELKRPL